MCGIMDCKFMFHKMRILIHLRKKKKKKDDIIKVISFVWQLRIVSAQLLKWTINLFCDFVYGNFGLYLFFFFLSLFMMSNFFVFVYFINLLLRQVLMLILTKKPNSRKKPNNLGKKELVNWEGKKKKTIKPKWHE